MEEKVRRALLFLEKLNSTKDTSAPKVLDMTENELNSFLFGLYLSGRSIEEAVNFLYSCIDVELMQEEEKARVLN